MEAYTQAYNGLNAEQKKAVETIDGPVMVIAGPGTGKTQVLALRIAHILSATDTPPDGILCLTFTNAGVKAMRERLFRYIGPTATNVRISTFHAFALDVIEEFHQILGQEGIPTLLDDAGTVALFDVIFSTHSWKYLRPRANPTMYFHDILSLISRLKRDRITPIQFREMITGEIEHIRNDPESISSRGETKGKLKKEIVVKLESLERTLEVSVFFELYEAFKKEQHAIDYNDALEYLVRIVELNDDARSTMKERYLYVLIDEHQDSSGVQNEFLTRVWGDVEQPNIFVVGDDRQLIYGFGGASLSYFEGFKDAFGTASLITLTHNYRSTQTLLDAAGALLTSVLTDSTLVANTEGSHPIRLIECEYPRDEILRAGLDIKQKISEGISVDDCAILVPKNHQVKAALQTLRDIGIPVAAASSLPLFALPDTQSFLSILKAIHNPYDSIALSHTLLDPLSMISPLTAHTFLASHNPRKLSLPDITKSDDVAIASWGKELSNWVAQSTTLDAYALIQTVGAKTLLEGAKNDEVIRLRVEIMRTLLHLALSQSKTTMLSIGAFLSFIDRLQSYEEDIPLAVFGAAQGVKVLTMHASKGLEFDAVWIAHMDERSLMGSKRPVFTLPQALAQKNDDDEIDVKKRELYVAMTRAKQYLTLSFAQKGYTGNVQYLADIIQTLPEELFEKETVLESEEILLAAGQEQYVSRTQSLEDDNSTALVLFVQSEYTKRKVSVTMLNNFFECPWKWYFRNFLALPEVVTESLLVGTVVHEAIEYLLKGGTDLSSELSRVALIETRYDENGATRLVESATPIVLSWQRIYGSTIALPFTVERNFSLHDPLLPHLLITGKIDLVEEIITDDLPAQAGVRVTDWKTGTAKTKHEIEKRDDEGRLSSYLRQLAMYSYLIDRTTNGGTTITESRLIFLEAENGDKNAVYTTKITHEEIALLEKDIAQYDELIKSGEWISRPCHTKTYGAGETCEYCKMAEKFGLLGKGISQ